MVGADEPVDSVLPGRGDGAQLNGILGLDVTRDRRHGYDALRSARVVVDSAHDTVWFDWTAARQR